MRLPNGSGVSREAPAPFCEGLTGKFRGSTHQFHKSIKQNASLEKSPTKKVKTQCNHVVAAMIAYCKLEMLKFKTGLNHFAIKYKLIVRANQIAMQELKNMAC